MFQVWSWLSLGRCLKVVFDCQLVAVHSAGMPSIQNMSLEQYQLYQEIQDIIGPASQWPWNVHQWFLHGIPQGTGQSHRLRPLFVAFFYVNGLNPIVLNEWCSLDGAAHPMMARTHYTYLYSSFERGHLKYMYAWNVTMGHYQYINGTHCDRQSRQQRTVQ